MKPSIAFSGSAKGGIGFDVFKKFLKRLSLLLFFLGVLTLSHVAYAQTPQTYDFSTPAALSGRTPSWPWNTTATISIGGVAYELSGIINDSWVNSSNGGAGNSASLSFSPYSTTGVTIKRKDGQRFKFYGLWLSYNCSGGSYTPPHLTVTYSGSNLPQEKFNAQSQQGLVLSKDVEVSSVTLNFSGLNTLYLDNLVIGNIGAALSSNANLSNLTLSDATLSPAFNANTINYTASVANAVSSVTVTPTKAEANATIRVNGNVLTSGATSATVNLSVGPNSIPVVVTAQDGSAKTYTMTVTRAAALVVPTVPDLLSSSDTGLSNSDNITNDNTPTFQGTAVYGSTVKLYANSLEVGTTAADGAGNWMFTTSALANGTYTFTARVVDAAGNQSPASAGLSVTIDTTTPDTHLASTPPSLTNSSSVTFTFGSSKPGSTFSVSVNGSAFATAVSPLSMSGLSEGTHTLLVRATDIAGNVDATPASYTWTVDQTAPVVTGITRHNPATASTSATTVTYQVSFNEPVTGVDQSDFTLAAGGSITGSISGISGSQRDYQLTVSGISGSGTLRLDVNASNTGIRDAAGNVLSGGYTSGQAYTVATTPLTASITSLTPVSCNGGANGEATVTATGGLAPYTYSWNTGRTQATAVGLTAGAYTVTVTDAMGQTTTAVAEIQQPASALQTSGSQTNVTKYGAADGTATVVATGGTAPYTYSWAHAGGTGATATGLRPGTYSVLITDANQCKVTQSFVILEPDNVAPVASNDSYTVNRGQTLTVAAPGLLGNDTDVEGAPLTAVLVTGPAHGTLTLNANGSFTYTHNNSASTSDAFTYRASDGSLSGNVATVSISVYTPSTTVASINVLDRTLTNASSLHYAVTFATPVSGVDVTDFALVATGTASGTIASVSGSGTSYTVQVNNVSGDGTLRLDFTGLTGVTPNVSAAYTSGQSYTIDTTSPAIYSVSVPANATYRAGQPLDFTVNFNESLTVATNNGTPALSLTIGTASRQAAYISGSGSTALSFRYTVQQGDLDMDGIALSASIALNGGTITDAVGNSAVLVLNGVSSTVGVLVDAAAPTITAIHLPNDGIYNLEMKSYLFFSLEFSEKMQHMQGSYLEIRVGTQIRKATLDWANGNTAYYDYAVQEGEQGAGLEVLALKTDATMPTDMQGNALNTGTTFPILRSNVLVDGIRPLISGLTVPANKIYRQGEHLDFTVRFSEKVELREASPIFGPLSARAASTNEQEMPEPPADGNPFIQLKIGEKVVLALYNQGSGTEQFTFRYTVQEGELDMDGIEVAPSIITVENLNPGPRPMAGNPSNNKVFTITDLAGNYADDLKFDHIPSTTGVLVDAVSPAVASITAPANGTYKQGENLDFAVQFTEPVVITGAPTLQLVVGDQVKQATYLGGTGTSALVFRYTVGAGDQDTDGISFQQNGIALNSGTIADVAGNAAKLGFGPVNMSGVLVDAVAPTLQSVSIASNNSTATVAKVGDVITLQFVASEAILQPTVLIAGNAATVVAVSGLEYRATYTMTAASNEGIVPFSINFRDLAGNSGTAVSTTTNNSRVTFDKTTPTGTLAINGGASHTASPEVALRITATDALTGVTNMRFSNDNLTWSAWLPFATSYTWTLATGNGNRQVYTQLRDGAGNIGTAEAQIILDSVPLTLTLSSDVQAATNKPFEILFTFSKGVTGFTLADLTVVNATASNLVTVDTKVFKATITPASEGEIRVSVAAGVAVDAASNLNAASNTITTLYDTTRPVVTLASVAGNLVRAPFEVSFTFSEQVTGFTVADIAVVNGTASEFAQAGDKVYTARITPDQEGEVRVAIMAGATQDAAGNGNVASLEFKRTYDSVQPTLLLATTSTNPTNAPFNVTFTFSEEVSGFVLADISVVNGTASNLAATDGKRYSVRITPAASGEVAVSVAADKAEDAAGNGNITSNILKLRYDAEKPTVVLATSAPAAVNAAFPISLTFSKEMTGVAANSLVVVNGTVSNLVKTDVGTYTALVTPAAEGRVEVSLPAGAAQDAAGNGNQVSNSLALVYDITSPVVTLATSAPNPTNRGFEVSISFSEKVFGLDLSGIAVTNATLSGLATTDNQTFTVQVNPSADGEVTFSLPAKLVQDAAGNGNLASAILSRSFSTTSPTVALSTNATNPTNAPFTLTIRFSKAVTGFAAEDLDVTNGRASDFRSESAQVYTALITPQADGEVRINVKEAIAQDNAGNGNQAAMTFRMLFDHTRPTVALVSEAPAAVKGSFDITITFSEPVTGFTAAGIAVTNGTASNLVAVSADKYTARITPLADGDVSIQAKDNTAQDAAGNDNFPSAELTRRYDATRPQVTVATTASSPVNAAFTARFTFTEEVAGFELSDITVTNGVASDFAKVTATTYTALITPAANGEVTVAVAASKATDAAGNDNEASNVLKLTFDTDKPTLLLTSTAPAAVNAPFSVRFAFSKDVTRFAIGDIALTNGAAADFAVVDARTYTVRVIPAAEGEVSVAVASDAAQDGAGNGSTASNTLARRYDITRPAVVVSTSASSPVNNAFTITFEFSENVSGFAATGIAVTNSTLSQFNQVDGRRYSALVTPAAAGEVTVQVPANAATDAASNGNLPSNTLAVVYDADRPAVVLASTAPNPINRSFQVSVTFTEPVTGLTAQDLTVVNATLSGLTTTDNQHYTIEVSPLADGLVTVSVPANVVQDAAGNGNTASGTLTRTFNATRPTLALSTSATSPTNAAFDVTFTFSKEVNEFEVEDIAVSNGAAAAFTQVSAQVYTVRITPTAEGEVVVRVAENVARDAAGNGNTAATALKLNIDKTQPTVVLASSAPERLNAAFEVTVTFSETVTGFTAADVTVVNGKVTAFTAKSDKAYTLQITPQANGEVRVSIAAGVAQDAAGNLNLASEQLIRLYDTIRPALAVATAVTSPVNTAFTARFTFSEAVEGFELNNITVENGSVSYLIKESATVYTALVTPSANGVVKVSVAENVTQDAFGNGNLASNQLQVSYDMSQPVLVLSTTAADVVKAPFEVSFTFSKAVTGFEVQDITVTNGAASAFRQVSALVYTALVTPVSDGEVGIAVAADVARDAAGNGNLKADALTRMYDATKPTLVLSTEEDSPTNAAFDVVFTFSEPVTGFAVADIAVAGGTVSNLTSTAAGKVYTATITPSAEGEVSVSVAADVAEDRAGNSNLASNTLRLQYDKSRPAVTLATTAPALTNAAIPVTIEFSEAVTGFALADITVTNGTAADLTKVSETRYSALVTPTADGAVSIVLAENKVADAATNGNTASNQLTLTYDGTAPAGYAIAWSADLVDVSNLDEMALLLTGAEPGATYTYRITSGQESTAVSGTGEVTEESLHIGNLDLEKLQDGTLTVQLYLTDKAGNKGAEVTAQVVKITRNIASVTEPAMIQVPIRTKFEQVPLPATVAVTYSTGEIAQVKVRWEAGAYDGTKAGPYVLTGTLELAEMTTNLDNLTAKVTVEVQPNKVPTALAFSATTFKPDATAADLIGTLTTTDPDDTAFVYTLVSGEGDAHNALFEIRGDQVYLKSNNGLSGMTSFTIRVRSTDPYLNTIERTFTLTKQAYDRTVDQLKIVNAFSPNGDGINDNWTIPELRFYNQVYIQVFDRSGVRVFETTDPEKGWDGRGPNGQILKGAFLFTVEVKDINWVKRGVVTILSK